MRKVKSSLLLFILAGLKITAQPVTFLKIYPNYPDFHTIFSVAEDYDGGYITALHGDLGILIKTDSVGNEILVDTIPCGYRINCIRETLDSNFVFSCIANATCTNVITDRDFMVYKITKNLDTIWTSRIGSTAIFEHTLGIRPLKDSSFIVYGIVWGPDNFYKIDSVGEIIWQHSVPIDWVTSGIQDSENNFVLTGYVDGIPNSWAVVKTDSTGTNVLWSKYYGFTGGGLTQMFHDVVQLPDSNYLLAGQYPYSTLLVSKGNGDSLFSTSYGSINSIDHVRNTTNLIVAGGNVIELLDSAGNNIWTKVLSNLSVNWIRSTFDGGFIAAGYYNGVNNYPMLLKTDSLGNFTTGIENLNIQVLNYSLYPNPLTTQSRLEFGNIKRERYEFTLYDITGREIETATTNGDGFIIKKGNKKGGLYFFKLVNTQTAETNNGKIIIR